MNAYPSEAVPETAASAVDAHGSDAHLQQRLDELEGLCRVSPSPKLKERLKQELASLRGRSESDLAQNMGLARGPRRLGFNDGVILPPSDYPVGTSSATISRGAADRAPLRGTVKVIVVLVDFSDKPMTQSADHFRDLFFSTGKLPHGSAREYFQEVSGGLIDLAGEVVGPYRLPQTLAWYANGNFGIGQPSGEARANLMARDAAQASNPAVNFASYDNDGNGIVDAFIVIHAGSGGEQTGNNGDIWSHKWTLPSAMLADGKKIYPYLTVPEDARVGVCVHELGHLLFGFPDLYDTDYTSEGIGNWCLMAGGSWNGGGDVPAHPSAWCKVNQGWVSVNTVTTSGSLTIQDVKSSRNVHRLWKDGSGGSEYFLIENRQRSGFDAGLPGDGLLIWHIDESQSGNTDESHYKVALEQADGKKDLEADRNRGDAGDPYPGLSGNTAFNATSTPSSLSYGGANTCVSISGISASGPTMTATVSVSCKSALKDRKDLTKEGRKEIRKELKERSKEIKDLRKDTKELAKERKDAKDRFEGRRSPFGDRPSSLRGDQGGAIENLIQAIGELEERVSLLELGQDGESGSAEPFIEESLRPDLIGGPDYGGQGDLRERMQAGDRDAKAAFDTPSP